MLIAMSPVGTIHAAATDVPKHWTESDVEGEIVIDERYRRGLADIMPGERIMVVFYFHQSAQFSDDDLTQHPRGDVTREKRGVFSLASPLRPNPIGVSILEVTGVKGAALQVKGLDMTDGTPVLDIKPCR